MDGAGYCVDIHATFEVENVRFVPSLALGTCFFIVSCTRIVATFRGYYLWSQSEENVRGNGNYSVPCK